MAAVSCERGWGHACPALALEWLWKPSGWLSPKESCGKVGQAGQKTRKPAGWAGGVGGWLGGRDRPEAPSAPCCEKRPGRCQGLILRRTQKFPVLASCGSFSENPRTREGAARPGVCKPEQVSLTAGRGYPSEKLGMVAPLDESLGLWGTNRARGELLHLGTNKGSWGATELQGDLCQKKNMGTGCVLDTPWHCGV